MGLPSCRHDCRGFAATAKLHRFTVQTRAAGVSEVQRLLPLA